MKLILTKNEATALKRLLGDGKFFDVCVKDCEHCEYNEAFSLLWICQNEYLENWHIKHILDFAEVEE